METGFLLKKVISAFLLPLPAIGLLLAMSLILICFTKKQLFGKILLTAGFGLLLLTSLPFFPDYLLSTLENRYPPLDHPPADIAYIVVLNGDQIVNARQAENNQLGASTLARLLEGIRLYQSLPSAKLLLSGGVIFGTEAGALLMEKMAIKLGVKPQDIVLDASSVDTAQQGLAITALVKNKPFVIVTSANHMPRTMQIFANLQQHPMAAPTNYFSRPNPQAYFLDYLPDAENLAKMKAVIHEYLGLLWLHFTASEKTS